MIVGVMSLQGDVSEHYNSMVKAFEQYKINGTVVNITKAADLDGHFDGIIIPGGESTVIRGSMIRNNMFAKLRDMYDHGTLFFGTCAGAILLSKHILNYNMDTLGFIDAYINRNGYGRQKDSFEIDLEINGFDKPFHAIFIRAPIIEKVSKNVKVLSSFEDKPVLAKSDKVLISTFHPELTSDYRIHKIFIDMIKH
ncbi:MAG: pyridoxal 5'-phosphate synthase glutaminase subunit PdxT [Thermoplasmata archaeon]